MYIGSILRLCNDMQSSNALKCHNSKVKTVDKFLSIYWTNFHINLCTCQVSRFITLNGQIYVLPVYNFRQVNCY